MEIFLDILKLAGIFPRVWRKAFRREDEVLRRNAQGLEIVVISRKGRIISSSIEVKTALEPSDVQWNDITGSVRSLLSASDETRSLMKGWDSSGPDLSENKISFSD